MEPYSISPISFYHDLSNIDNYIAKA